MSNLFNKLFIEPLEREANAAEAEQEEVGKLASFVRHPYFEKALLDLRDLEDRNKPQPGEAGEMLYAIGVRDGIEMARQYLESRVAFVKEHRHE